MKRMLSVLLTAALLLAGFAAMPALAETEGLTVPQALVDVVAGMPDAAADRYMVCDITGDGVAELVAMYYRSEAYEDFVNYFAYCEVYAVDGAGQAAKVYTNGGEPMAGAPSLAMMYVDYGGARRIAYQYSNFGGTRITYYEIFMPDGQGGVSVYELYGSKDVAGDGIPEEFKLNGAPISSADYEAINGTAETIFYLATPDFEQYGMEGYSSDCPALSASQFLAVYGPQAAPASASAEEAPAETGRIAMLSEDTQYTQLGLTVDAGDIGPWTSVHTDYIYDAAGRLVSEQTVRSDEGTAASTTTSYTYDETGRLVGRQTLDESGSGEVGAYEYDEAGRLSLEHWYDADGTFHRWIRHFYDAAGRETEVIQGYGSVDDYSQVMYTRTGYDSATGRILYQDVINGAQLDPDTHAVLWYDENDTSAAWHDEYTYDQSGALYCWSTQWGGQRSVRYMDEHENVTGMEVYYQDELRRTEVYENTYDGQGDLLQTVRRLSGEGVLCTTTYTYGPVGMAAVVVEEAPPAEQALSADENYNILRTYWLNNVGLDCSGVLADVDGDGLADFTYVDEFTDELLHSYVLTVKNGEVRRIVLEEGIDAHVDGYFNLFVRKDEAAGTAELIDYTGAMYQGYGYCSFSVYHLDQDGNRVETDSLVVTDNGADPISEGQLAVFYGQAAQLLDGCVCLYTSGLDYTGALDNVLYPQVTTDWIFDMGIVYQ